MILKHKENNTYDEGRQLTEENYLDVIDWIAELFPDAFDKMNNIREVGGGYEVYRTHGRAAETIITFNINDWVVKNDFFFNVISDEAMQTLYEPVDKGDMMPLSNVSVYTPSSAYKGINIFLGGSIEMGKAVDWQQDLINHVKSTRYIGRPINMFNPRRDDYDSTQDQKISNEYFNHQVTWELENLERADIIVMNFEPGTTSPISLLELGLFTNTSAEDQKFIVCCPEDFFRSGNIDIVSKRYNIELVKSKDELKQALDIEIMKQSLISKT